MRKELLKELLQLSKLQTEALEKEDVDALEKLIEKKQGVIDRINEINSQQYIELDPEETKFIQEIRIIDNKNNEEFNRQYEEVKFNIRRLRENKMADRIYSNPYDISVEEGIFFDKR